MEGTSVEAVAITCSEEGDIYTAGDHQTHTQTGSVEDAVPLSVEAKQDAHDPHDASFMAVPETTKRSYKYRATQRLCESMGLQSKTKNAALEAARQRHTLHALKVSKLADTLQRRDNLLQQLAECEVELATQLEDLAAASPLEKAAGALAQAYNRQRDTLEHEVLPEATKTMTEWVRQWHDDLAKSDVETSRRQEATRLQLDHYRAKATKLRKAKDKRDQQTLDRVNTQPAKSDANYAPAAKDAKADEKYSRNEAKLNTAQADFNTETAAAIRVFDAAVVDRWHDLAPLLSHIYTLEAGLAKLRGSESGPFLGACVAALNDLPPVVPLRSRLYFAKTNQTPPSLRDFAKNKPSPPRPPPPPPKKV